MCGITGIFHTDGRAVDTALLGEMTDLLRHRGPDDEGYWIADTHCGKNTHCHGNETAAGIKQKTLPLRAAPEGNLGFGFRRLSILDLTDAGHQPMTDPDGRACLVFNGEIYNHMELRPELEARGVTFRSHTDSETVLYSYLHWGPDCVKRFNGMWAFAIWDAADRSLFCSRDRFGVKPFYYRFDGKSFIFASEMKSILAHTEGAVDEESAFDFFFNGVSSHRDRTFVEGVRELRGAHSLRLKDGALKISPYYEVAGVETTLPENEILDRFRALLTDAVRVRLRSDVPVGCSLSGGVDSSSIALLVETLGNVGQSPRVPNVFSTVYPGEPIDESDYIDAVLRQTRFTSHRVTPTASDFLRDIKLFLWHHEEPSNDASYYGEFVLRRLIKRAGVTVSLEGQGADEVVGGYFFHIYPYLNDLIASRRRDTLQEIAAIFEHRADLRFSGIEWVKRFLEAGSPSLYGRFKTYDPAYYLAGDFTARCRRTEKRARKFGSCLNQRLYEDLVFDTLPAQVVRADKSAMAFAVECRFPFLDYRLVDLAFRIPPSMKIRRAQTKYVLRESMKHLLPDKVYRRRDKLGFPVPQAGWFRSEMKEFLTGMIHSETVKRLPYISWDRFRRNCDAFFEGKSDFSRELWQVVSFCLWKDLLLKRSGPP